MRAHDTPNLHRFQSLHASLFAIAVLSVFLGLFAPSEFLLVLAGTCFVASGAMTVIGNQIMIAGPLGDLLRHALGDSRLAYQRLRGYLWIGFGILLVVAGAYLWSIQAEQGVPGRIADAAVVTQELRAG